MQAWANSSSRSVRSLGIDEGALGQGELDAGGVDVAEFPLDDLLDRLLGGQENRADEAGQIAGGLDDARVGRPR